MLERELNRHPQNLPVLVEVCEAFLAGGEQRQAAIDLVEQANPGTSSDLEDACPLFRQCGYID